MDERRNCVPLIYVKGSHYECGFDVGRTFASLIQKFLRECELLNERFLPAYNTAKGQKVYEETLSLVKLKFPHYVSEIQGIADGANVDFYKLMLFHFDEIIANVTEQEKSELEPNGCSTIYVKNSNEHVLGHTEDAAGECLNSFYLVSAHILADASKGIREEKFTALCYPGHIGGYTMGYNNHGLILTINTLVARKLSPYKTPRHFLTRALLAAENYDQAIEILKDSGVGAADGCSLNMLFVGKNNKKDFLNIEMAPAIHADESQLDILNIGSSESMIHCNHYLRMNVPEYDDFYMRGTKTRYESLKKFPEPFSKQNVIEMLGDTSHDEFWVYRCQKELKVKTICVGIFDFIKRTWSIYKDNPKTNGPVMTLHLDIDE